MYPEFRYFLEAYCTLSLEEEALLQAIEQFKEHENQEIQRALQGELQEMLVNGKLKEAKQMIEEYGHRQLTITEAEEWMKQLAGKLQKQGA